MIGYLFIIFSSLLYGVEPSIRTLALQSGVTPSGAMDVIMALSLLLCGGVCLVRRVDLRIPFRRILLLVLIGGFGLWGTSFLLASSYTLIPVGYATVIHFLYPTLTCLVLIVFFGKKLTLFNLFAMLFSIAGLFLICDGNPSGSTLGFLLAFSSGCVYVFYILMLKQRSVDALPFWVQMFYITLGCVLFCGVNRLIIGYHEVWTKSGFFTVLFCGLLAFGATLLFAGGVKKIGASAAAFFSLLEPVTSLLVSTKLYHYSLTIVSLIGCTVSLLSILMISLDGTKIGSGETRRVLMKKEEAK
jgi:drug/metabolite transporter (DMT)-like permease